MEKQLYTRLLVILMLLTIHKINLAATYGPGSPEIIPATTSESKTEPELAIGLTLTSQIDESCSGAGDGSFTFTITGITVNTVTITLFKTGGNFTTLNPTVSGGTATAVFSNLSAGDYTAQASFVDNGNFQGTSLPNLSLEAGPAIDQFVATEPSCNGVSDGAVRLIGIRGTGPYTYSMDGNSFQTSDSFSGLSAGTYTFYIKDTNGCTVSQSYQLTEPDAITAILTETPLTCNGDNSGSIAIQASGGDGTYEYSTDGTNFSSNSTFTGLAAGSYTVTIRDGNNCTGTATVTVTEPVAMTATLDAVTNVSCNGASDGSFSISITGGTAPYVILDATGNPVVQVSGNVYTAQNVPAQNNPSGSIRDANGCTVAFPNLTISEPTAITVSIPTRQNMSCNNVEDGSITALATGGTGGPYEYSIDGVNFQASNVFENLDASTYLVTARDANNCTSQSATVFVYEPLPITGSVTVDSNVTTCGANDGAFTVNASGHFNSTTYEYSIDGGATYQSSASFTGLAAGNYDVTVKNVGGTCTILLNATITDPVAMTATASQTDILCNGASTGIIDISNVMGGTAPYEYSLDGTNFQTSNTFTNLTAGTYTTTIKDAGNCTHTITSTLVEASLIQPTVSVVTDVRCSGESTGFLSLTASGGTGPYEYSLDGTNFGSGSFAGLSAGNYTITVRDASLCTVTTTATVNEPTPITGTATVTDVTCNGDSDGAFTITATGGVAPYAYSLDGGSSFSSPFSSSATLSGLSAGNYSITLIDANNCTEAISVSINEPTPISVTYLATPPTCIGDSDGKIQINLASGGTGPLMFRLQGTTTLGFSIQNLSPGDYDVEMVDANGCTVVSSVTVPEASPVTADVTIDANASGCGNTDGAFTMSNPIKGTGFNLSTVEYSIDGVNFQTSPSFTGLAAGTYTVTIKDVSSPNNGTGNCEGTVSVTITEPSGITASLSTTDILCNGANTGVVEIVNVSGGIAPYEYSVDGNNFQTADSFTNLAAGSYTITVKDASNCTLSLNTTLTEADLIQPVVTVTDAQCSGDAGSLSVTATGGTGPYEYSVDGTNFGTGTFVGLVAGNYTVTVRDASLCTVTTTATVNEPAAIAGTAAVTDVTCNGDSDGAFTITTTGGVSPYTYSLDGTNFSSSASFSGLSAGNYSVVIKDASNCTEVVSVNIDEPDAITASHVGRAPSCIGDMDGQIQINLANGGTGLLQIRLQGTTNLSSSIQNLAPGDYTVETVDTNGCFITSTVTVPEAAAVTADVTVDANASGCGNADGAFTMSNPKKGSGINLPTVEYSIDGVNFQSSPSFTGLTAGVYSVTIKDVSTPNNGTGNCEGTVSVTITEPSGITATVAQTDLSCNGDGDGTIGVTNVAGGTSPYEYSIDGTTFGTSQSFTGLSAGSYNITVKDASGCTASFPVSLTEPDALVATVFPTDISCNGAGDGSVTVSISGGTAPYYWLDVATFGNNNFQTINGTTATYNAVAGSRTGNDAVIVDGNGCLIQLPFTINEPTPLAASITNITDVTCNGGTDGTVTITATGGTAPYEATADGTQYFPLASDGVVPGIGAVTIANITVRDANGCDVTIAGFTVNEPAPIAADVIATAVSCNGNSDGSITITPTSVTSTSFEYSIDGTNFSASNTFTQLNPGSYSITIRETGTNCENVFNTTVTEPDILEAAPSGIDVTCSGQEDGTISGGASGGTAPYEYSIDGGTTYQTEDFTGLDIGSYTLTVRDANGCTDSRSVVINEPVELLLSITTTTDVSCNGLADGSATEAISGGTTPYSYSLDAQNFSSTIDLTTLSAGSYTLTVKDANDCTVSASFTINEPSAIVPLVSTSTDISCNGLTDGSLTVTATGGEGTFMYSIDGTNFSATNTFTNLAADTYTVTVQDGSGCTATIMQAITEPAALNLQFEAVDISCNGAGDGQIAGIATGGTAPYTYSIDGTNFQSTAFSGLAAGNYTLTVKDANGCETTTAVVINEPAVLASSITSTTDVDCNGNSTGSAVLDVTGGSTPYNYSLDGSTFNTSIDLSSLSAGAYTVTVRDANSCESTASFTITEPDVLGVSLGTVNDVSCNGATDGNISVSAAGGTAPYQYSVDGSTFDTADTFSNLAAGNYTLTVQDANGCTATVAATVAEPAAIVLSFTTADINCNGDSNGEIIPATTGGTGPYEYSLDGTNFQSGAFTGQSAGTYMLTVRDANGCTETASVTLTEPVALTGTVAVTNIDCFGEANGSVTATATGGTAPYEYSTDGSTFQSGNSFDNLAAGSYTITIRDANACTITVTATVTEPAELTVSASVINDNTISITASGGTAPYEYALDNGAFQSASTFSGLRNGDYSVTVRDANGCTVTTTGSLVVTGTDDPFTPVTISAYPNPVSDYLTFSRLAAGDQIRLVSLNGNSLDLALITEEKEEFRMDISSIRQKVFLAIVVSKGGRIKLNKKVMKTE